VIAWASADAPEEQEKDTDRVEGLPGTLKKTPLNSAHREAGAKMVGFSGWEMPVEYSGLLAEHLAVRKAGGLFDVSHMGEFTVEGPGALAFLQRTTSNNVAKLALGQGQYSALPMENGAPADDLIVYRRGSESYLLVVNAGNIDKDFRWLESQGAVDCTLKDRSGEYALLALQGPLAQEVLSPLTDMPLASLGSYRFSEGQVLGQPAIVSRTGYTGEDGFEIFLPPEGAVPVWKALLEGGGPKGVLPAGLGARDTLRLEARMCLYGNDMDESTTLVEAGLSWIVSLDPEKGPFIGREVLAAQKTSGAPRKLVGFEVTGRGIARHGYPCFIGHEPVGSVTSGSFAPSLQKNIGLTYLPSARSEVGTPFEIEIRGRRVEAKVVPTPFYKRPRPKEGD
jgi:aminomethyltransferase